MHVVTIDSSCPATGTGTTTNPTDRTTLQSFIIAHSLELADLAHEAAKYKLFYTYPEAILSRLASSLHRYGGPIEEVAFLKWATRFVAHEAQRYEITGRILTEYEDLIFDAIHRNLWTSAQDWAIEPKDIFWEVALLIFQRAHSLDKPGTAKLSTRIYALVKKHVYKYHTRDNVANKKSVRLRQSEIRCEYISDEELAAMRADAKDDAPYDPGYADVGLTVA